jgi:hypothetical protein
VQNAPYPQNGGARLSPEDQRDFDRYYSQWVDDSRRNDRDDAARDMQHMRDIMARNNIPPNIPFEQIATANGYPNNTYNNNTYSRGAYSGYNQTRMSPDDQKDFDKAYAKWVKDSAKNDRDDIENGEEVGHPSEDLRWHSQNTKRSANCMKRGVVIVERYLPNCVASWESPGCAPRTS